MDPRTSSWNPPVAIRGLRLRALFIGVIATVVAVVGGFADRDQFFRSYVTGFVYVLAFPLGALGLMMLNHVTRGAWGVVSRRILEASARTFPLVALLFLPIAIGLKDIFVWADPEVVAHDALIAEKQIYLNAPFFFVRAVIYFAVWIGLSFTLSAISRRQDDDPDPRHAQRMQAISAGGLVAFMLTLSFASFDWIMSLDPHWFSSIYGAYYAGGSALGALAFTVVVAVWLSGRDPMAAVYRPAHFHDWGKLMLAFTMLWAYFSVSQLIIIWSGNLPEEVPWYLSRTAGVWKYFAQAVLVLHFFVPFALLLSTDLKRDGRRLVLVAVWILAMRWVDLYWHTAPSMHAEAVHWMDIVLPIGLFGLWVAYFFTQLGQRPLVPRNEPFLQEALGHHG